MPFGEEVAPPPPPSDKRLFTGKERDSETGLDYSVARYDRAHLGRFTTIDPLMTIEENLVDPQRWNRCAYTKNNPLRFIDPDGATVVAGGNANDVRDWLREGVGSKAAEHVDVVWNKGEKRWQVAIVGIGVAEFRKLSSAASLLADAVGSQETAIVKASTDEVPTEGGPGYTYDIGTRGSNAAPVVLLNKDRYGEWATVWNNTPKGWSHYEPRTPSEIKGMTMGLIAFHELGHAWGNMNGIRTASGGTADLANAWENAARESAYPMYSARRIIH